MSKKLCTKCVPDYRSREVHTVHIEWGNCELCGSDKNLKLFPDWAVKDILELVESQTRGEKIAKAVSEKLWCAAVYDPYTYRGDEFLNECLHMKTRIFGEGYYGIAGLTKFFERGLSDEQVIEIISTDFEESFIEDVKEKFGVEL